MAQVSLWLTFWVGYLSDTISLNGRWRAVCSRATYCKLDSMVTDDTERWTIENNTSQTSGHIFPATSKQCQGRLAAWRFGDSATTLFVFRWGFSLIRTGIPFMNRDLPSVSRSAVWTIPSVDIQLIRITAEKRDTVSIFTVLWDCSRT